jgi:dipeptidyl aminopeptidase/acylaminoacyl peptidase
VFVPVADPDAFREIGRRISPINHVTPDDPPVLIIHGDADKLVPIQQAQLIIDKLTEAGVPAKLVVKKGAAHGWRRLEDDIPTLADWFDTHLAAKPAGGGPR